MGASNHAGSPTTAVPNYHVPPRVKRPRLAYDPRRASQLPSTAHFSAVLPRGNSMSANRGCGRRETMDSLCFRIPQNNACFDEVGPRKHASNTLNAPRRWLGTLAGSHATQSRGTQARGVRIPAGLTLTCDRFRSAIQFMVQHEAATHRPVGSSKHGGLVLLCCVRCQATRPSTERPVEDLRGGTCFPDPAQRQRFLSNH